MLTALQIANLLPQSLSLMQEQSIWFPFSNQNYKSGFGSCE